MNYDDFSEPIGNIELLGRDKVAFVSNVAVPEVALWSSLRWAAEYDFGDCAVLCGFSSYVEQQVLMVLLGRGVPAIVPLATHYLSLWPVEMVRAVGEGRLLVFSVAEFELPWMTIKGLAARCNAYMVANSVKVFVGHCHPKSILRRQLGYHSDVSYLSE